MQVVNYASVTHGPANYALRGRQLSLMACTVRNFIPSKRLVYQLAHVV